MRFAGSFIFRNEGDGCLTSKYINNVGKIPYVECCKRTSSKDTDNFVGIYDSVWIEDHSKTGEATLTISINKKGTFDLKWTKRNNGNPIFDGIGMIVGDLLVGAYWNS